LSFSTSAAGCEFSTQNFDIIRQANFTTTQEPVTTQPIIEGMIAQEIISADMPPEMQEHCLAVHE
jgi:hypothetical protein